VIKRCQKVDLSDALADQIHSDWKHTGTSPDFLAEMEAFEMAGSYGEETEVGSLNHKGPVTKEIDDGSV
jgi:hypothetical protein